MVKRILSCTLAILLVLGMVGCSSNNNDNPSTEKDNQTNETNSDKVNEYGIKESDMQDLYATIKSDMLAYFKEKDIDPQTFEWPNDDPSIDEIKDDFSNVHWKIIFTLLIDYVNEWANNPNYSEEKYRKSLEGGDTLSTYKGEKQKIMIEVGISMIDWISSHPDIDKEFENGTLKLENIPWNKLLPANIDFTK